MHPSEIRISDYTYTLPDDRIALHPLEKRDESRLLIWQNGQIREDSYKHIAAYLPAGALLVFNDTRVIAARIHFTKKEGGRIEVFLLDPAGEDAEPAKVLSGLGTSSWKCLIGGASKWKHGYIPRITTGTGESAITLEAEIVERLADSFIVKFQWTPATKSFAEVIEAIGEVPLPPYLKRPPETEDRERYQTIFAHAAGSVAAPTAGLHFTKDIFQTFDQKNISSLFLTLHVGAGTFRPVKSETMAGHIMHAEWMEISMPMLETLINNRQPLFAVGTTSLRTLESIYWMGYKCFRDPKIDIAALGITQWEVYDDINNSISVTDALHALMHWMQQHQLEKLYIKTGILIAPGYRFQMIDGLITNFHQPQSTLLLLVAALAGESWRDIYDYALENDFRFLSYGDGCLIYNPGREQGTGSREQGAETAEGR